MLVLQTIGSNLLYQRKKKMNDSATTQSVARPQFHHCYHYKYSKQNILVLKTISYSD
jgi:hypothetical protein